MHEKVKEFIEIWKHFDCDSYHHVDYYYHPDDLSIKMMHRGVNYEGSINIARSNKRIYIEKTIFVNNEPSGLYELEKLMEALSETV